CDWQRRCAIAGVGARADRLARICRSGAAVDGSLGAGAATASTPQSLWARDVLPAGGAAMRKLYACLRVPDFAVAVVFRRQRSRPAVVFSGAAPNVYVYEANAAA